MDYEDLEFYDGPRRRRVPVRVWRTPGQPRVWILFSSGFGCRRSDYAFLGRAWAARGFATCVIEHVGSNFDVLQSLPGRTRQEKNHEVNLRASDAGELEARPRDVVLVRERLRDEFAGLPFGVGGHSFGAYTALASLGLPTVPPLRPLEAPLKDAAACLVISPQKPGLFFSERALGTVGSPTLVLTSTLDVPLDGVGDYRDRARVYDTLPEQLRNLVILEGVEHMAFAGEGQELGPQLRAVESLTARWWDSIFETDQTPESRARSLAAAVAESADTVKGVFR